MRLLTMHRAESQKLLESYIGSTVEVLIEDSDPDDKNLFVGRAWFQAMDIDGRTFVNGRKLRSGSIVKVEINDVIDLDLFGNVLPSK